MAGYLLPFLLICRLLGGDISTQALVVVSKEWKSTKGVMTRYEKRSGRWQRVGKSFEVLLGYGGMGCGIGLKSCDTGERPSKREGDGRSPAGVFELPFIFTTSVQKGISYPVKVMGESDICIDDPYSENYNRIADRRDLKRDYRSFEVMKRGDGEYDMGIFVSHNPNAVPGRGSCIFIHIRSDAERATVGCTAMEKRDIEEIARWLDIRKRPRLYQAPISAIGEFFPPDG
jgi:D-alanyl-D-alanine dipeptidase